MERRSEFSVLLGIALSLCLITPGEAGSQSLSQVLPLVEFSDTPLPEVIDYLRMRSLEGDPAKQGTNFVIAPEVDPKITVSLKLRNVSIGVVVICLAEHAALDYLLDPHACRIVPFGEGILASATMKRHDPVGPSPQAERARLLKIETIEFSDAPVQDVLDYLSERSRDNGGASLNFVANHRVDSQLPVTLNFRKTSAAEVLTAVAELTGVEIRVETYAILIEAPGARKQRESLALSPAKSRGAKIRTTPGKGKRMGTETKDPRSPTHLDYVPSNHIKVEKRSNALNNVYKWVGGKWTFVRYGGAAEESESPLSPRRDGEGNE